MAHRDDEVVVLVSSEKFADVFGKDEDVYLVGFFKVVSDILRGAKRDFFLLGSSGEKCDFFHGYVCVINRFCF